MVNLIKGFGNWLAVISFLGVIISLLLFERNPYDWFLSLIFFLFFYIVSFVEAVVVVLRRGIKSNLIRIAIHSLAVFIIVIVCFDEY